jgi:hypothetical protein
VSTSELRDGVVKDPEDVLAHTHATGMRQGTGVTIYVAFRATVLDKRTEICDVQVME